MGAPVQFIDFYNIHYTKAVTYAQSIINKLKASGKKDTFFSAEEACIEVLSLVFYNNTASSYSDIKKGINDIFYDNNLRLVSYTDILKSKSANKIYEKVCSKCRQLKSVNEFRISSFKGISFLLCYCKPCELVYQRERMNNPDIKQKNKEYLKEYYLKNRDKILKRNNEWSKNNKEKVAAAMRKSYAKKKAQAINPPDPPASDPLPFSAISRNMGGISKQCGNGS